MFKLTIKTQDNMIYWVEYFNTLTDLNNWLIIEKSRPYWNNEYYEEILDLRPEVQPDYEQKIIEQAWEELRSKRNSLLQSSDFTQLNDCPLSDELKINWAQYRQQLRDLPDNTLDPLNPVFPLKPS